MNSILQIEVPPEKVDSAHLASVFGNMGAGDAIFDHFALQLLIGVASGQHPCKDASAIKTANSFLATGLNDVIAVF